MAFRMGGEEEYFSVPHGERFSGDPWSPSFDTTSRWNGERESSGLTGGSCLPPRCS